MITGLGLVNKLPDVYKRQTVVWLVLMARYARKGFLASIVQLFGNLISLLGARQLSAACARCV